MGEYGVSIIHINSSTIAISIVEPQNDADTFINSCGETGERPAIRVMITINDVYVTAKITSDKAKKITVDINYTDDVNDGNINVYDIILGVNKAQLDSIKNEAATNVLRGLNRFADDTGLRADAYADVITAATSYAKEEGLSLAEYLAAFAIDDADITDADIDRDRLEKYVHKQNVKVYNGLLEFAVDNNLVGACFRDVIRAATKAANDADKSVVDYLTEFAIDDADIMDDGVIDDDD